MVRYLGNLLGVNSLLTWLGVTTTLANPPTAAAAGADSKWKGQNAGSGNTDGGDIVLEPGAKSGSGVDGGVIVRKPAGVVGTDELEIRVDTSTRFFPRVGGAVWTILDSQYFIVNGLGAGSRFHYQLVGTNNVTMGSARLSLSSGGGFYWTNSGDSGGTMDAGLARVAASVSKPCGGSVGADGWFQQPASMKALTANVTNNSTTFANLTALTFTLIAARKYLFWGVFYIQDATAADGFKIDFNGGATLTITDFIVDVRVFDTALVTGGGQSTVLGTALTWATVTGAAKVEIKGFITVNAGGTFIPRQAKNSDAAGALLTTKLGSNLVFQDMT